MGVVQGFSWFRSNIRRALLLLILAVLLPVLGLLVFTFVAQLHNAFDNEMQHDLALARGVGEAFEEHVRDIARQELTAGTALASLESFTAPQADQYLKTAAAGFASVSSMEWLTAEGTVIASSNPSAGGPDPRSQPWFREVLADTGRPFVVSDLLPGQSSGDFRFTIARGIRDANGKLLGVIEARVDVGRMELRGLPVDLPGQMRIVIFDRQGVLAYRRPEVALTLEQRQWRGKDPHLAEALAGRESSGRLRSPIDGADLFTARVPVKSIGWVAGAGRPYEEVMRPLYSGLAVNLATMLVIAAVSVLLANLISRSVTRPLSRLRTQAIAIGKGDLDYRTEVRGVAELEELSGVLNRMADSLKAAQEAQSRHVRSLAALHRISADILAATAMDDLLQRVADGARALTASRLGVAGHGYVGGTFRIGAASRADGQPPCPPGQIFRVQKGGVYLDLITTQESIRLTEEELHRHPVWWGLPENHTPLVCLLGTRLIGRDGKACGLIMVSDKESGGDFTEDDEAILKQLAAVASLAVQHIEARAEAEARATENVSLARFPSENPNPICRISADAVLIYANEASRPLLDTWGITVGQQVPPPIRQEVGAAMASGRNAELDAEAAGRMFSLFVAPVREAGYANLYGRDVTERRKAQEELRRINTELEQRTEELTRSNQDLEQFAYVASHDLQEPLRIVAGYIQLLEHRYKAKLDKDAEDFINFAVDGVTRMQNLIQDLLAYSRVGTRGQRMAPVDCEKVLDHALAYLRMAIQESGAVITHDPLPTVTGDEAQLVQLMQNLVGNAIKFRGQRKPEIHVGARPHDGRWLFWVKDNGIGIEPQYRERIFVIFQRLHGREKYAGTGIGLALCKRIVERHGGRIWVESEEGQGSTFYFTL